MESPPRLDEEAALALLKDGTSPSAWVAHAHALFDAGDYSGAAGSAEQALAIDRNHVPAWVVLAAERAQAGDYRGARRASEQALGLAPDAPSPTWNLSMALLWEGDLKRGFELYESGKVLRQRGFRAVGKDWRGERLGEGKRLFVWGEQGDGDQVMFWRFVKDAKARAGCEVVVECARSLQWLLSRQGIADHVHAVFEDYRVPVPYDAQVSIASLPLVLGVSRPQDVCGRPYIKPVPGVSGAVWGGVGLCTKGSPGHPNDAYRSWPPAVTARLKGMADWVGLDKASPTGIADKEIGSDLSTWAVTAAAMEGLDRVVTADTAVAHLAGAMGKDALVVVPLNGEWRWGDPERFGDKSYWYESVTLARPASFDDVPGLVEKWLSSTPRNRPGKTSLTLSQRPG